jgi:group I intron endonuclease
MGTEPKNDEASDKTGASSVFIIYCHIHMESGRRYVGLTGKKWERRWSEHLSKARSAKNKSGTYRNYWYNALNAYGPDSFEHEVLQVCHSVEEANLAEQYWIGLYDTTNPIRGFNIARGGAHTPHPIKNPWDRPEYREKALQNNSIQRCLTPEMRAKSLAALRSPESQKKRSEIAKHNMARPDTQAKRAAMRANPEYSKKISESTKAALSDPEVRKRIQDASASRTPELIARIGQSIKKAFEDPEVKERHRFAVKEAQNRPEVKAKHHARVISEETRAKISAASKGFRHTEEGKEEMRRLFLERRARLLAESGFDNWSDYISHKIALSKNI